MSSQGSPSKRPIGWGSPRDKHSGPPPCSALFEPDQQRVLLPASLVQQYYYFPLVLVQLPMYNEEAHCEVVIERACNMVWPRHRVIIQVGEVHHALLQRSVFETLWDMLSQGLSLLHHSVNHMRCLWPCECSARLRHEGVTGKMPRVSPLHCYSVIHDRVDCISRVAGVG